MTPDTLYNKDLSDSLTQFESYLEQIIRKEVPLRDPSISVIHITPKHIQEAYTQLLLLFKRLKEQYSQWDFHLLNIEQVFYAILDKFRYTKKPAFVKECERQELEKDLRNSVQSELIKRITQKLEEIKIHLDKNSNPPPPVLCLLNMHAVYPHIQTKDIIARLINKKGILILIPYLQSKLSLTFEKEQYKDANYNVHTIYLA